MGQRTVKTESKNEVSSGPREFKVDAGKVITRLQQQRADLASQVDILSVALEEAQEREAAAIARIAELEDK